MKKLLTLTAIGALLTAPATAVQKCVAFNASTTTCTANQEISKADWSSTCTTNGISVPIRGIGMCSNQKTASAYGTADNITTSGTNNVNCWCKMVEPAVSSWVFLSDEPDEYDCSQYCSYYCAGYIYEDSRFRSILFGSISN